MDLDLFRRLIQQRSARWVGHGVRWEFHRGPTRDKSAAVDCESEKGAVHFIVWTSCEAEMAAHDPSNRHISEEHYEVTSEIGLIGALDDLEGHLGLM